MAIRITKLSAKDIPQTHKLLHSVIRHHNCYSNEACRVWEHFYTPARLKKSLRDKNWLCLIAKDKNKIIGFANIFQIYGGVARSDWTLVHPDYRHHGVGHALMAAKFKECKKLGCHKIETDSIVGNEFGKRLLEETGWKKIANLKNHWFGQDYYLWERFL